jgi:hypothetical protein
VKADILNAVNGQWSGRRSRLGGRLPITTAGDNLETLCGQLYQLGKDGVEDDFLFHWTATYVQPAILSPRRATDCVLGHPDVHVLAPEGQRDLDSRVRHAVAWSQPRAGRHPVTVRTSLEAANSLPAAGLTGEWIEGAKRRKSGDPLDRRCGRRPGGGFASRTVFRLPPMKAVPVGG